MRSSGLIRIGGRMPNVHEDLFHLIKLLFFLSFFLYFILLYYSNKYSIYDICFIHFCMCALILSLQYKREQFLLYFIHSYDICVYHFNQFWQGSTWFESSVLFAKFVEFWQMVNCFQFCFRAREKLSYSFRKHF